MSVCRRRLERPLLRRRLRQPADAQRPIHHGDADSGGTMTASFTNRRLLSRLRLCRARQRPAADCRMRRSPRGWRPQKHLLRALFTADGVVDGGAGDSTGERRLLDDVQLILIGFGVNRPFPPAIAMHWTRHTTEAEPPFAGARDSHGARGAAVRHRGDARSDATACVSTRAASAPLFSTSASSPGTTARHSAARLVAFADVPCLPPAISTASPRSTRRWQAAGLSTSPSRSPAPSSPTG